jgi:hypothetical protein
VYRQRGEYRGINLFRGKDRKFGGMEEMESVKEKGKQNLVETDRCLIGVPGVNG